MSMLERLRETRVLICAGAGGVGKTTTSAAVALGLAARGRRTCVVTIDPAPRLADALGIDALGGEPQRVDAAAFTGAGLELTGELWAMTLDPKATFDGLVSRLAPDDQARDRILEHPIYRRLSVAVAGSQEFTAVARLYDLARSRRFDVIVLDTPPSRNALDFLDAPDRLTAVLEGRGIGSLLTSTGVAARVAGRGSGIVLGTLGRLTGIDLLRDIQTFVGAFGAVLDGFRERAAAVSKLLADETTTFLVITSPERDAAEEAIFFTRKLREADMEFGGLVVGRVTTWPGPEDAVDAREVAAALGGNERLAAKVMRTTAELRALAARDRIQIERLAEMTGDREPVIVPELPAVAEDAAGLVAVERALFG